MILKKQVDEEGIKVDFSREDALCRSKLFAGINQIASELR